MTTTPGPLIPPSAETMIRRAVAANARDDWTRSLGYATVAHYGGGHFIDHDEDGRDELETLCAVPVADPRPVHRAVKVCGRCRKVAIARAADVYRDAGGEDLDPEA